jgi:hypothetical protein
MFAFLNLVPVPEPARVLILLYVRVLDCIPHMVPVPALFISILLYSTVCLSKILLKSCCYRLYNTVVTVHFNTVKYQ